jgi:Sortase domain
VVLDSGSSLPAIPAPSQAATAVLAPRLLIHAAAVPFAKPVWIKIPAIGVSAPVTSVGLNPDGTLQVPPLADRNLAAWYDKGAAPGQEGPAVMVGHVDSYLGPSVFFKLHALQPGETIEVSRQGAISLIFTISRLQQVTKSGFPTRAVYGPVSYPALRLITCGGTFDPARGSYDDNVIVFAILTGTA